MMKFKHYWLFILAVTVFCACKKEQTEPLDNFPNYHFGQYAPTCGFAPPCSDWFWLINGTGIVQVGNDSKNVFNAIDNLGQVDAIDLENSTGQSLPFSNETILEDLTTIFESVEKINQDCFTYENALSFTNTTNYFVLIPIANNRFQVLNLNSCQINTSNEEKANISVILDWLAEVDEQI